MGVVVPRQRNVQDHQERLSAATWSVLAEHGPTGLTLRAVASRAGCTTGLVLHTFPDKRALLLHARHLLHARTTALFDSAQGAAGSSIEQLLAVLRVAASIEPGSGEEARVWLGFLAAAMDDPELAELHRTHNRRFVHRVERLVSGCRGDWDRSQVRQVARELVALVEGLNVLAALDPRTYPRTAQAAAIERALDAVALVPRGRVAG